MRDIRRHLLNERRMDRAHAPEPPR
jgi:hypothetical protein